MAKKKGMGAGMWVIMGLLILSLGGFGVTQFGQSATTVATVGDVEVSANDYARAVQNQMNAFQQQTRQPVTFQTAQALGLDRIALGTLITSAALENETIRVGLSAGDELVSNEIRNIPSFQGLTGEFDRQNYELALRQNGLNVREFEDTVRADLATGLLRRAVGAGLQTPDVFVDTLFNHARETRDVTWARLGEGDLDAPISEPNEDELTAFHSDNAADFTKPETKVIRYAWVTPDMLASEIEVDEAQLRNLYDARIDEFVSPERRLIERLIFPTSAAADEAKARLDAGEVTFDDLVAERGLTLGDIDMGDVAETELGDAGAALFALAEPGVAGPLPSDLGPALYRMNGILAAENVGFEEARETLAPEAAAERARRLIAEMIPDVEDLLAGGADPALIAERTELQEGTIDWNIEVFDDVAAYSGFRAAAAAANVDSFGDVIQLDDGGILTLKVEEVQEPALLPLDDVRDRVIDGWRTQATQDALAAKAEALSNELMRGAEMAGMDLALETNRGLRRDGFVEGTPPAFISSVFDLEPNGVTVLSADGDAWLVRLDAIIPADGNAPDAQLAKDGFALEVTQSYSNAITNAFTQALVDSVDADINATAIQAVNSGAFLGAGHGGN